MRSKHLISLLAVIGALGVPSAASAVTVGQAFTPDGTACSTNDFGILQLTAPVSYRAPSAGTLTSFSTGIYDLTATGTLQLVVWRETGTVGTFQVVGIGSSTIALPATS